MSWQVEKALDDLMAQETGAVQYPFGTRHAMAICYPNTYDVAMSNLGMQIIYREVNGREDWLCERAFLPDKDLMKVFEKTGEPLISLENRRPLSDFEILGLSVSFEMDYFNVPTILEMGRIPVLAADRDDDDTLVVMGGPVAFFNAEPLSPFVDVVLVGEGERFIHTFLDAYGEGKSQGLSRHDLLRYLAIHVPGVYVPSLYRHEYDDDGHVVRIVPEEGIPAKVERQWHELTQPAETVIATPNTEFGAMYLIEIARGCGRHCRFCMAGYCYRRPRVRPLEYVKSAVLRGKALGKKIGLMGAAISDYPYIDELVTFIRDQGLAFSCASCGPTRLRRPSSRAWPKAARRRLPWRRKRAASTCGTSSTRASRKSTCSIPSTWRRQPASATCACTSWSACPWKPMMISRASSI